MIEGLGPSFLGTSNCLIALRREVEAVGTKRPRIADGLCGAGQHRRDLAQAPYRVLADWQQDYEGNLGSSCPTPTARPAS
jgi:nicotinate phosphoribosyltransferase